ncbi:MAG: DMT family transporter [Pseudomonadales bacterium]|nr:DMT family transporter [Pseudomonadales bacterium]
MHNNLLKADLLLVLVTVLAAAGWIFSKEALVAVAPFAFLAIRFVLAALTLAVIRPRSVLELTAPQWKWSLLSGLTFALAICIWIKGLSTTSYLGEGAFITSMAVLLVPLVSKFLFKELVPLSAWVALPIAVLGLAFLTLADRPSITNAPAGVPISQIYFLAAAICFAFHFVFTTYVVGKVPAYPLTMVHLFMVGCVSGVLAWNAEQWDGTWNAWGLDIWGWILASAWLATCMRFFIQTYAQGLAPASHAAVILILEPVLTTLAAWLWFSEALSAAQILGCSLIFGALIVNRWRYVVRILKH